MVGVDVDRKRLVESISDHIYYGRGGGGGGGGAAGWGELAASATSRPQQPAAAAAKSQVEKAAQHLVAVGGTICKKCQRPGCQHRRKGHLHHHHHHHARQQLQQQQQQFGGGQLGGILGGPPGFPFRSLRRDPAAAAAATKPRPSIPLAETSSPPDNNASQIALNMHQTMQQESSSAEADTDAAAAKPGQEAKKFKKETFMREKEEDADEVEPTSSSYPHPRLARIAGRTKSLPRHQQQAAAAASAVSTSSPSAGGGGGRLSRSSKSDDNILSSAAAAATMEESSATSHQRVDDHSRKAASSEDLDTLPLGVDGVGDCQCPLAQPPPPPTTVKPERGTGGGGRKAASHRQIRMSAKSISTDGAEGRALPEPGDGAAGEVSASAAGDADTTTQGTKGETAAPSPMLAEASAAVSSFLKSLNLRELEEVGEEEGEEEDVVSREDTADADAADDTSVRQLEESPGGSRRPSGNRVSYTNILYDWKNCL